MPACAVGRTQLLLYLLAGTFKRGTLPAFPVYLDSPMAIEATRIHAGRACALGRRIMDGDKIPVRAPVHAFGGLSGHAGQQGLLEWIAALAPSRPRVIRVRGDVQHETTKDSVTEEEPEQDRDEKCARLHLGAAIVLVAVLFHLLVGHFVFRFRFDDLLGTTCGVAANPAHAVFASKLVPSDRTDVAYAITFPTGTIMKVLLLQVMLAAMGSP